MDVMQDRESEQLFVCSHGPALNGTKRTHAHVYIQDHLAFSMNNKRLDFLAAVFQHLLVFNKGKKVALEHFVQMKKKERSKIHSN